MNIFKFIKFTFLFGVLGFFMYLGLTRIPEEKYINNLTDKWFFYSNVRDYVTATPSYSLSFRGGSVDIDALFGGCLDCLNKGDWVIKDDNIIFSNKKYFDLNVLYMNRDFILSRNEGDVVLMVRI